MADTGGANRIELESQILCAALRQSWAENDTEGVVGAGRELYQLFPDLLPAIKSEERPKNLYQVLEIDCDVSPSSVLAGYFRQAKKFLRSHDVKEHKPEFYQLLDAGFILRKPRLRLSHDMIVVRALLIESKVIPEEGTFEMIEEVGAAPVAQPVQMVKTQPLEPSLPMLVELLKSAQIIGLAEVQALSNQMNSFPDMKISDLILSAGYVTDKEMKSLQLAEYLLSQGKITMGQFCVAMYDERTTGIRMAESLQVRGWLETETRPYS